MSVAAKGLVGVRGRQLSIGHRGELIANDKRITRPAMNATVTVSDESANVRTITIQLLDANGKDIDYVEFVEIIIVNSADGTTLAAPAPSTGLAAGTDGALMALKAHNWYIATCESDGDIDLTWTDTGTATAYIAVRLPNGNVIWGDQALTNA